MADGWDSYPHDWDQRRRAIYQRDEYQCQNCGRRGGAAGNAELHCHHIVPKSKGGSHDASNLVTLCRNCHNQVHDHHIPKMSNVSSGSRGQNAGLDDWQSSTQASESLQAVANEHFESETEVPNDSDSTKTASKEASAGDSRSSRRMPTRTWVGSLGWILYGSMLFGSVFFILSGSSDAGVIFLGSLAYILGIPLVLIWTSPNNKETISVLLLGMPVCFVLGSIAGIFAESTLIRGATGYPAIAFSYALSRFETSNTSYYRKIREQYTVNT